MAGRIGPMVHAVKSWIVNWLNAVVCSMFRFLSSDTSTGNNPFLILLAGQSSSWRVFVCEMHRLRLRYFYAVEWWVRSMWKAICLSAVELAYPIAVRSPLPRLVSLERIKFSSILETLSWRGMSFYAVNRGRRPGIYNTWWVDRNTHDYLCSV